MRKHDAFRLHEIVPEPLPGWMPEKTRELPVLNVTNEFSSHPAGVTGRESRQGVRERRAA